MSSLNSRLALPGGQINYERAGAGRPLTFVHGHTLDMSMWEPQFARFRQDHSVLRYDLRGYGKSSIPLNEDYMHCDDLHRVHQGLDIESTTLIGMSLGGQVALEYAVHLPENVEQLILIDPFLIDFGFSDDWNSTLGKMIQEGIAGDLAGARQTWKDSGLFTPALDNPHSAEPLLTIFDHYSGWHFEHPFHFPLSPITEKLGNLEMPVLIIVGAKDIPDFIRISSFLEKTIPNATRVVIPGAGHMSNLEAPDLVNEAISSFLGQARSVDSSLDSARQLRTG